MNDTINPIVGIVGVIVIVVGVVVGVIFLKKRSVKNQKQHCPTCGAKITNDMVKGYTILSQNGNKVMVDVSYLCANCQEIKHVDILVNMDNSNDTQSIGYLVAKYFEY